MNILAHYNSGRVPSERIKKHALNPCYGIMHFSMNTYTNKEWGFGDESIEIFDPADFDADQIAEACKNGGLDGIIIVCKHHDGFCLWPTKTTPHNISRSPWRNGKGDIVGEMVSACRKAGLKVGFYVSPWDRNHPSYGTVDYPDIFREQLREICTNYGQAFEIWFDGANGGDGFYGGACEQRKIDASVYYDWQKNWGIVRELQPDAVIFSDIGPDIRWVGNEKGFADPDAFASYTPQSKIPGKEPSPGNTIGREGTSGHADGHYFMPFECDFPLRPGWFYHPEEEGKQRSGAVLLKIYLQSVGCGGFMNVGISPDRLGRMTENDIAALRDFKKLRDELFSNCIGEKQLYIEKGTAVWEFEKQISFNFLELQEDLTRGEAVCGYTAEARISGKWQNIFCGKAIGLKRLKHFRKVTTNAIRITITETIEDFTPEWLNIKVFDAQEELFKFAEINDLRNRPDYRKLDDIVIEGLKAEWHLAEKTVIKGIIFTPENTASGGMPLNYELAVYSSDGEWNIISQGEFANIQSNPVPQVVTFKPVEAAALRLTARRCVDPDAKTPDIHEFGILI